MPHLRQMFKNQSPWQLRMWTQNLRNTQTGRIDTWAHQWTASLWRHNLDCVSPNRNLVRYTGRQGGTHIRRRRWSELEVSALPPDMSRSSVIGYKADAWLARKISRETVFGYIEGLAAPSALGLLRADRRKKPMQQSNCSSPVGMVVFAC